ncbi:deazaflavin-dependent nitroreductase [Nocardia sp. NPDC059091]|uniref:deazaflavin-dependent nitroreductase n=1 Tax=unclassified Nocardia TaxID=2637762 RepID=UPI00368819B1
MTTLSPKQRFRNRVIVFSHRIGLPFGPMHLLTVPGRKTGRPQTTPIAPVLIDGIQYLVRAYPDADWVRNARTAGHGTLTRGRHVRSVDLIEIPESERGPILREFPTQNPRGVAAFVRNGLVDSETPDSFAAAARRCPLFRVAPLS